MTTQQIISVAASADDARTYKESTIGVYPPNSATAYSSSTINLNVVREYISASTYYWIAVTTLKFDTSTLPATAVPISAFLRMVVVSTQFTDGLSVVGEYFTYTGTASDYTPTPASTAFSGVLVSSLPTGNVSTDFTLLNPRTSISLTGATSIRLHMTQLSGDAAPTGRNNIIFAAQDHTTLAEPRLVVNYELSTRMAPDAILSTNLAGSISDIQDDPRSPDANWLTI